MGRTGGAEGTMSARGAWEILRSSGTAVVVVAFLATLIAEWRTITDPLTYPVDSTIHTYWMFRFDDPELFRDDPLSVNRPAQVPPLLLLVYRLGSLAVSPVTVSKLLPLLIVPLTVWLLFRIVREVAPWQPAAWIAALVYLFAWDVHRFSGGHARAFAVPIALAIVLLGLHGRDRWAAAVAPLGALVYPPAALTGLGILGAAALRWRRGPRLDHRRAVLVLVAALLTAGVILVPRAIDGSGSGTGVASRSRAEMAQLPEYGPQGQRRFFADSRLQFLKQNRSGFDLRRSGSLILVAAALLVLVRPRRARMLPREVWALPIAALGLFALAHALVPRLYWPHRYTYPLIPFGAIAIGSMLRPAFEPLVARWKQPWIPPVAGAAFAILSAVLALTIFPLGPEWTLSELGIFARQSAPWVALGLVTAATLLLVKRAPGGAIGATLAAAILIGGVMGAGGMRVEADPCRRAPLLDHLATLPKDAVIAGDPEEMNCVPIVAKRPVVMSRKLYGVGHRERMRDLVEAYYGDSVAAILALRERYSADYLVVQPRLLTLERLPRRWRSMEPFTSQRLRLMRSVRSPAILDLPRACRTWRRGEVHVVDLACVAEVEAQSS